MTSVLGSVPCPEQSLHPSLVKLPCRTVKMGRSGCVSTVVIGKLAAQALQSSGALFKIPDQTWDILGVWGNQRFSCN